VTGFNVPKWIARPLIWAIVLGFVGLIFGYYGQDLLLAVPGNLGPLAGILVTGPMGLVLGVLLGGLSAHFRLSARRNLILLAIAALVGSVVSLYGSLPAYRQKVWLVDAEIVNCEHVDQLLASKTKMWSEVAARPHTNARPNWEQEVPDMFRAQPGAVLTIRIYQEAWIRELEWSWGGISQRVDDWQSVNETKQVFAAIADPVPHSPCERFTVGERRFSAVTWEKSNSTPPEKVSRFLWLGVLQQVPPVFIRYIPKPK
jgi:hypothetical protein